MLRGTLLPKSNRESFVDQIELIDTTDGTLWVLTGCTVKIRLESSEPRNRMSDYSVYYYSSGPWGPAFLDATTENGAIVFLGNQALEFTFTENQMASLPSGQYRLSATIARLGRVLQLFQFDIPILDGGVAQ